MVYVVTMEDTITYRRVVEITVEADNEEAACYLARDGADEAMSSENVEEEQIDNTPYRVLSISS